MRKTYYNIIGAACLAAGMVSCGDYLEIKSTSEIVLEDFWNEKADVDNVVSGCYSALLADGVRKRMMIWGEVRSDNIMSGENINNDVNLYNILKENITAMNGYTTWDGFYDVINRCNTVLKYAPGVAAIDPGYTDGDLKATVAEVSALRDLCYFYLIRTFRDVPYSTEAFTDDNQVMDLPATPFETVLDNLIKDLESIKDDAVNRYPEDKPLYQTGRITKNAIYAMLCEMYLWKKDYDNCIRYAELVIQNLTEIEEENRQKNGKRQSGSATVLMDARLNGYPLVADNLTGNRFGEAYRSIFVTGASKETIFELSYNDSPSSSDQYPNNSAITSLYGSSNTTKGLLSPSTAVTEDISTTSGRVIFDDKNKKIDARLYQNCDADKEEIKKFAAQSVEIDATNASNTTAPKVDYSLFSSSNNGSKWIIYRLPDIMLLEAEALCQKMQEGSDSAIIANNRPLLNQAFKLVNAINKRSICKEQSKITDADTLRLGDYTTKNLMDELVQRERQRELMFEGKRWYDLVRYCMRAGNTEAVITASQRRDDVNKQFALNFFKKMDAIFWPYNNEEMKVNRNLVPNPAFGSGESTSYEKTK